MKSSRRVRFFISSLDFSGLMRETFCYLYGTPCATVNFCATSLMHMPFGDLSNAQLLLEEQKSQYYHTEIESSNQCRNLSSSSRTNFVLYSTMQSNMTNTNYPKKRCFNEMITNGKDGRGMLGMLQDELAEKTKSLKEAKKREDVLKSLLSSANNQVCSIKNRTMDVEKFKREAHQELVAVKSKNELLQSRAQTLQKIVRTCEEKFKAMDNLVSLEKQNSQALQKQLSAEQQTSQELKTETAKLRTANSYLEARNTKLNDELVLAHIREGSLEGEIADLKNKLKAFERNVRLCPPRPMIAKIRGSEYHQNNASAEMIPNSCRSDVVIIDEDKDESWNEKIKEENKAPARENEFVSNFGYEKEDYEELTF